MPENTGDSIFPLSFPPGAQTDGTLLSSKSCVDTQWCRFYRKLPKKMGGYKQMIGDLSHIVRGVIVIPDAPNYNIYYADQEHIKYTPVNNAGTVIGDEVSRTPLLLAPNSNYLWDFDIMFDSVNNNSILIASGPPNLYSIDQTAETPIYYGDALGTTPLIETGLSTSGGIVALHPYLFIFGNNGLIQWTEANDPTTIMDDARVTSGKIVAGFPTRAGNSSPGGVFWSLDSLIRCTQTGTTDVEFTFDTVAEISILSSKSIVEYNGIYYWAGTDAFYSYNGFVEELPNEYNLRSFFGSLNYSQRQKVWATKITEWGEIWWFFPTGNNVECNQAVVFNVRDKTWYETLIVRTAGYFEQTLSKPVWAGFDGSTAGNVWRHETDVDKVTQTGTTAIESYFETPVLSWMISGPNGQVNNIDRTIDVERFEPDFIQTGEMMLEVKGQAYANSTVNESTLFSFLPTTEKVDIRTQRRLMTLKISSNAVGGNYQMGIPLVVMRPGDTRP